LAKADQIEDRKPLLFYPNDTWKVVGWDVFISLVLLITCITTPFDIAFGEELADMPNYVRFRNVIDFIFLIDIFVNFNTAIQEEGFKIDDNRCSIIKKYAKGWFLIDFLSIVPFEPLLEMFTSFGTSGTSNEYNRVVRMSRMSKLYKLVKITRLMRVMKIMKKGNTKQLTSLRSSLRISKGLEKLSFFFLILMLMCHFVCCIWIFTAKVSKSEKNEGWIESGGF
jgi:hypothetical protein